MSFGHPDLYRSPGGDTACAGPGPPESHRSGVLEGGWRVGSAGRWVLSPRAAECTAHGRCCSPNSHRPGHTASFSESDSRRPRQAVSLSHLSCQQAERTAPSAKRAAHGRAGQAPGPLSTLARGWEGQPAGTRRNVFCEKAMPAGHLLTDCVSGSAFPCHAPLRSAAVGPRGLPPVPQRSGQPTHRVSTTRRAPGPACFHSLGRGHLPFPR